MNLRVHELRRDRIRLRKILSAHEVASYHSWADEKIFKEVRKPEKSSRAVREKTIKYGKDRFKIAFD